MTDVKQQHGGGARADDPDAAIDVDELVLCCAEALVKMRVDRGMGRRANCRTYCPTCGRD